MTNVAVSGLQHFAPPVTEGGPLISIVVVFARRFEALRRTLTHLRAQTIADRIELIVVAPSTYAMRGRRERDTVGFHSVREVIAGEILNVDKAGALAVHAATAPIIAFIEDHAFPAPDWAELVVEAHREWDVVGTAVDNGNPATGSSWANHLVTYGPWLPIATPGERDSVSRHNSSFRRDALRGLGDGLTAAFGRDATLLKDLRRAGHRLYLETRTSVAHVNPSRVSTTLWLRYNAGKIFAHKRVLGGKWGLGRRAVFAAAAPVYPFIRLRQIWGQCLGHPSYRSLVPRALPALAGALVADAVGQAVGYLAGAGRAVDLLADFEAERAPHIVAGDQATLIDDADRAAAVVQTQSRPTDTVRVGIIGCGRVVQLSHLRTFESLPGARLTALAEPDDDRRTAATKRAAHSRPYADWRELLRDPEVDAVLIAAPPALHAEMAIAAFEAGKHVYLEKPIAASLADAARIVDAWRACEPTRVGMIGHNLRCHPLYHAARNMLEQGRIGRPVLVRTAFTGAKRDLPDWKRDLAQGGGVVLDLATHHVDLCRFLLGEDVESVALEDWGDGESALVSMRMRSGLRVESFFSLGAVSDDQCEITGDKGRLVIDRYAGDLRLIPARQQQSIRARASREGAGIARAVRRVLQPPGEPSYRIAMERFVRAIQSGGAALPDLDDGYRALELVLQARRGAR
ncbi:MAG TPA: Gfo/Idh/MocA family oxidoreductase [Gemmatimonadaceae bacterium]|nr:Gfo/Idh/MocA family oxidoreductase [Gemmatimonadaceae bacterium]